MLPLSSFWLSFVFERECLTEYLRQTFRRNLSWLNNTKQIARPSRFVNILINIGTQLLNSDLSIGSDWSIETERKLNWTLLIASFN